MTKLLCCFAISILLLMVSSATGYAQGGFATSPNFAEESVKITVDTGIIRAAPGEDFRMPQELMVVEQGSVGTISRADWETQMNRAIAKRNRGMYISLGGLGVTLLGTMTAGSSAASGSVSGANAGNVIALIGVGAMGYGGWVWLSGRSEVEDLDRQGRANGYLSLAPTMDGGVQLAAAISF